MTKIDLFKEALSITNKVTDNPDVYITGVLLNDCEVQNHIEILAYMQSIIMQSLQVNYPKRSLRYIIAFSKLLENNHSMVNRLEKSITDYMISK